MIDYTDHTAFLKQFKADQEADSDRREAMREIQAFLHHPQGQWEPSIARKFTGKPKYTFDRCTPLVESVWGKMAENDFDIKVRPDGGGATKENGKRIDGLVRKIERLSNATQIYKQAGKGGIEIGFDCAMVTHKYVDSDSFDQDLLIEHIPNALDRVWFGPFEKPTAEDAPHVTVLGLVPANDEKRYGRKVVSIGTEASKETWTYKREQAVIGRVFYKDNTPRKLYLMSDDSILSDEDKPAFDELAAEGITVIAERNRPKSTVMRREFDEQGWLGEAKPTPFKILNVVPLLPNFRVIEGKVISRGIVEKRMDEQRVLNYAGSRGVDDFALSAKEKLMVGASQAKGREDEFTNYSTSEAEVQLYEDQANATPPYKVPANQGSGGLQQILTMAETSMERGAGVFGINPQNNTGLQSNVALERLENRGDIGTYEYFSAQETMICQIAKVLVGAIPGVYKKGRAATILKEDGSDEEITLGKRVVDQQTGQEIEVIDLSTGIYDVTCDIGPAFANRRAEANEGLLNLAGIDPSIIAEAKDVLLNNHDAPGMDVVAERVRLNMVRSGLIPESQMTEEEKQLLSEMQGEQTADPAQLIGEAELLKAQTQAESAQLDQQIKMIELQQKQQKLDFEQEKQSMELLLKQNMDIAKTLSDLSSSVERLAGTPLAAVPAQQIIDLA